MYRANRKRQQYLEKYTKYLVFLVIRCGSGPSIRSIMAKCSKLSCVYNTIT